jgi:adenine-specific DNA-methyltransferase
MQPRTYNHIKDLFNLLATGDSSIGVHGFGKEVFTSGDRRFFSENSIYDKFLNDVLLRLSCQFDKKKKDWFFIDYQRLSIDHMGSIFEGLLEFKLQKTKSGLELVNTSGERKTTGSYYTPEYVVDYIVKDTIGPLVDGKKNSEILKLKIVDPAMGSGHFLLGVVRYLEDRILENINNGDSSLSMAPSKIRWAILHSCAYGSDINPLAKDLAKFSLWMFTASEGSELEPLDDQLACGDSLRLEDTWKKKLNCTSFDAVVGNPPYVRQEFLKDQKEYLEENFQVFHAMADLYSYFIELSHKISGKNGRVGLIVTNKWMRAEYGAKLRGWLLENGVSKIVNFGDLPVFKGIAAYPCIITLTKGVNGNSFEYSQVKSLDFNELHCEVEKGTFQVKRASLSDASWMISDPKEAKLGKRFEVGSVPLATYVKGTEFYGIKTGCGDAFVVDKQTADSLIKADPKCKEVVRPFAFGREIQPYAPITPKKYVLLMRRGIDLKKYPSIEKHLNGFKARLMPRPKDWKGEWKGRKPGTYKWYELQDAVDYIEDFKKPKIMFLKFQVRPAFTLDYSGTLGNDAVWSIALEDHFLLAFLNSKIGWYLISKNCTQIQGGYQLIFKYLGKIPVRAPSSASEKKIAKEIESKAKAATRATGAKLALVQNEINQLFYQYYALSQAEIKIIEDSTFKASAAKGEVDDELDDAA